MHISHASRTPESQRHEPGGLVSKFGAVPFPRTKFLLPPTIEATHRNNCSLPPSTPSTCKALLVGIRDWLPPKPKPIITISSLCGLGGVGRSVSPFFCISPHSRTAEHLTAAAELASLLSNYDVATIAVASTPNQPIDFQSQKLVVESFHSSPVSFRDSRCIILIDELDECDLVIGRNFPFTFLVGRFPPLRIQKQLTQYPLAHNFLVQDPILSMMTWEDLRLHLPIYRVIPPAVEATHQNHPSSLLSTASTRQDLVYDDIIGWIPSAPPILWLYEHAGASSGKSVVVQTESDSRASFFLSHGSSRVGFVERLVATIANRLVYIIPTLHHKSWIAAPRDPSSLDQSIHFWQQKLPGEPFESSYLVSFRNQKPHLVTIDGLDECHRANHGCNVSGTVSVKYHVPFPVLVPNLPPPHVQQDFEDIRIFLRQGFDQIIAQDCDITSAMWPSEHEIDGLVRKSSGLFIYASTVVKFVATPHENPVDQLKLVLSETSDLDPFSELDQLYHRILTSIGNSGLLLRILGCILVAQENLSASDLKSLLGKDYYDLDSTLQKMHALLNIPGGDNIITFFHISFADFLRSPARARNFHLDENQCHTDMAYRCIHQMENPPKNTSVDTGESSHIFGYASHNWIVHCRKVVNPTDKTNMLGALRSMGDTRWRMVLFGKPRPAGVCSLSG